MPTEPLCVFEHEKLRVGERGFTRTHFKRLLAWNEANGYKYFSAGPSSIKFAQYVGVIQVGDLVIEILPKADATGDEKTWQQALLDMLSLVHDLPLSSTTESHLHKRRSSILDFFFGLYLEDVYGLVRRGLVKKYHHTTGNQAVWKGRLHWPGHLKENLIRKERFHVVHQVYDRDHVLHALLKRALSIIAGTTLDPLLQGKAKDLSAAFEDVDDRLLTTAAINRIKLSRKTEPYARAVRLAQMIVLDHAPDLKGGRSNLIGLVFDMNQLFERVVLKLMRRSASRYPELAISGQDSRRFWGTKTIRPDIVIRRGEEVVQIIDTKWKVPSNGKPSDDDLKQMYVYNLQFGSTQSMLLYPHTATATIVSEAYEEWTWAERRNHGCTMEHIQLFDPKSGNVIRGACDTLLATIART
ncbi:MAG: restriction endonuclease [Flavobacteriales bacterium]|nr:restriction endonuclease [Flavobacteriales bacterium]